MKNMNYVSFCKKKPNC